MGMDIYLDNEKLKAKRDKAHQMLMHYARLRDQEKDKDKKAKLQKEVEKWFAIGCSPKNGYFRVNYNDYSLSYWLKHNIDEKAKGDWGIEPFYSAIKGKDEPIIDSEEFRTNMLETVTRWYQKAFTLKDKESFLLVFDTTKSDLEDGVMVYKTITIKPDETNYYIDWLKDLVEFAELAVKTKSPIYVSA